MVTVICPFARGELKEWKGNFCQSPSYATPKYLQYKDVNQRIKSFVTARSNYTSRGKSATTAAVLAEAGFFHRNCNGDVVCFQCGGGLTNYIYDEEQDPWALHAKWFSRCPFLLIQKGKQFVQEKALENRDSLMIPLQVFISALQNSMLK